MTGKTIPEIFAQEGEQRFREYELEYLHHLTGLSPAIVSCGGGIVSTAECREMLKNLGFVVFMEVDPKEAISRISSFESRPILARGSDPVELLQKRMPMYLEVADMRYDTSGKTASQVSTELGSLLEQKGLL